MCSFPKWISVLMKEGRDAYFYFTPKVPTVRYPYRHDSTCTVLIKRA